MEWLILLVVPIALLVFATHLLAGAIALRELPRTWRRLREQHRAMPPRARTLNLVFMSVSVGCAAAVVWVIETPSAWGTARWVLLAGVGLLALYAVVVLPALVWREYRARRRRRAGAR